MKIKTTLLMLSLLTLFITSAFAQTEEEKEEPKLPINSNRKYKNEVAIDLSALHFLLHSGSYSLFFRRHFTKSKDIAATPGVKLTTYHAYRFRVGSNLSFVSTDLPDIKTLINNSYYPYFNYNEYTTSNSSSLFIRIGKEKQIRSKQFELYYGYDFSASYYYSSNSQLYLNTYNTNTTDAYNINVKRAYTDSSLSFGISPIVGLKYFLLPRLCFSAEATANLNYSISKENTEYSRYDTSTEEFSQANVPLSTNGITLNTNSILAINLGYYF